MLENIRKTVKIKDLGEVITGTTPPTQHQEYFGGKYLFIKPSDISTDQRYVFKTEMTLSDEGYDYQKRKLLPKNSICVVCIGTIGKMCFTSKPSFTNQQLNSIIVNQTLYDPTYVYYLMKTYISYVKHLNAGSASGRENVNKSSFENLEVEVHELPIQRKIAAILSAYDRLIENNTRRIEILEEMARSIYREWFVNFRFPGHEQVKMVDSELGLIPEGWEVKKLGEVSLNFDNKRKPLSSLQRAKIQGKYPYYGAAKIFDYINNYIFEGRYLLVAEDGSVITKDRRPVLQLVDEKFWVNNHTHVIQGKEAISTNFLYLFMSDLDISGYITGAAQPKINQTNLNRIPIIVPRQIVLKQFNAIIDSLLIQVKNLKLKNANLRQTRDLLLPRLISGEIDVENLDINTSQIAA